MEHFIAYSIGFIFGCLACNKNAEKIGYKLGRFTRKLLIKLKIINEEE